MKRLHNINKWLMLITLLLYITLCLGMLFQMVLGVGQVLMSFYMLYNYNKLEKQTKFLFNIYLVLVVTILSVIAFGTIISTGFITTHLVIPMLIAFFHLYITYKIQKS
jgi:hypothetical protein